MSSSDSSSSSSSSDSSDEDTKPTQLDDAKATAAKPKSKLVEDSAEESGSEKDSDDEGDEADLDKNEYEKDGFVVSDEDSDGGEESDEEKSKKRKRKRLRRGRGFVADEDDIQLIQEATNEDKQDDRADKAEDSDEMDDFIVDDTNRPAAAKRRKATQNLAGAGDEDTNAEFTELFGYSKEEFEAQTSSTTEREYKDNTTTRDTIQKELRKKLDTHYEHVERAENYLLETDELIRGLDKPERVALQEKNKKRLGKKEPFLRDGDPQEQRRRQGEWVYEQLSQLYKSRLGEAEAQLNFPPMYDLIEPIIRALHYLQACSYEVTYIYFHLRYETTPLTLDDLWDVYDLAQDYCDLVELNDVTIELVKSVVPDGQQDEERLLFVSMPEDDAMDTVMDADGDEEEEKESEQVRRIKNLQETAKWKPRLLEELKFIDSKRTQNFLRGLREYILFRFGAPIVKQPKPQKNKAVDSLFDDMSSSDEEEGNDSSTPQNTTEQQQASGESGSAQPIKGTKLKRRKAKKSSMFELQKEFVGIDILCRCIGSIPHFAKSVLLGERLPSVLVISENDQSPESVADAFLLTNPKANTHFTTPSAVFLAVVQTLAKELFLEPRIKQYAIVLYRSNGTISTKPTLKGRGIASEPSHEFWPVLELEGKPFAAFVEGDDKEQFLLIDKARKEGYVKISVNEPYLVTCMSCRFADALLSEEGAGIFKRAVNEGRSPAMTDFTGWDQFRFAVIDLSLKRYLSTWITKEMKNELLDRCHEQVARRCAGSLFNKITVAPCHMPLRRRNEMKLPNDWFVDPSLMHVMGVYLTEDSKDDAGFAVVVNGEGGVVDFLKLYSLLKRDDLIDQLKSFITDKAPHLVVFNDTAGLRLRGIYTSMEQLSEENTGRSDQTSEDDEDKVPHNASRVFLPIVLDTYVASAYASSERALKEFKTYTLNQRKAVSMARFIQDPLLEIAGLFQDTSRGDQFNTVQQNTILNVNLHPLQSQVKPSVVLKYLERVLVNVTALVGVDINLALKMAHARTTLQFVAGLGPRKSRALLEHLARQGQTVGRRLQIKKALRSLHKSTTDIVYTNSIAFLRVLDRETTLFDDDDDEFNEDAVVYEPLDQTRLHPAQYKTAGLVCWSALQKTKAMPPWENGDEELPDEVVEAVKKVMKASNEAKKKRLHSDIHYLSTRASNKWNVFRNTGLLIGDEATEEPYALTGDLLSELDGDDWTDLVAQVQALQQGITSQQATETLTLVLEELRFPYFEHRRELRLPTQEEMFDLLVGTDEATIGAEVTARITDLRNKFVNVRLSGGLRGSIHISEVSDNASAFRNVIDDQSFADALYETQHIGIGDDILCRVIEVQKDRWSVRLCARESKVEELARNELRPRDTYWRRSEATEQRAVTRAPAGPKFRPRRITHPNFHNVSMEDALEMLKDKEVGDIVFRPSSRGLQFLSCTWKVGANTIQHFVISELHKKPNNPELSKQLQIKRYDFEDLDEIIARYVTPMNSFAVDIYKSPKYRDLDLEGVKALCAKEKSDNPSRIPYFVVPNKDYPGHFIVCYQPNSSMRKASLSLTPEGLKFDDKLFIQLDKLIEYFKKNFNRLGSNRRRGGNSSGGGRSYDYRRRHY